MDAIRAGNGLFLDTVTFQEQSPSNASTEVSAVRDAQFVLFCVKTLDTENAARAIAPHLCARMRSSSACKMASTM